MSHDDVYCPEENARHECRAGTDADKPILFSNCLVVDGRSQVIGTGYAHEFAPKSPTLCILETAQDHLPVKFRQALGLPTQLDRRFTDYVAGNGRGRKLVSTIR